MAGPWKLRGYVVERLLGAGATSEVWRARVSATGEAVALKRLLRVHDTVAGLSGPERLASEAAVLSALEHPNLIRLHAVVRDRDTQVLVLDLAEGGSLAELLAARGRLTPGEVVTALYPVGSALAHAHAAGVVHGDVSPANLLFTAEGSPLLADLGVARLTGDEADAESTPAYVEPSVAAGCVPGPGSDVFMLGAVALHALTGRPPWPAGSAGEALHAARVGVTAAVTAGFTGRLCDAGVPAPLAAVVLRALSADPGHRGSAADFALDLRHAGTPVAVELRAGRSRRDLFVRAAREAAAGRDQASSRAGRADRPRAGGRHAAAGGRSSSRRPQPADPPGFWGGSLPPGPDPDAAPPTTAVEPRPRPSLPGTRRLPSSRSLTAAAGAVVVAATLAAAGLVWAGTGSAAPPAQDPASAVARTSAVGPGTVRAPGSGPASPSATATPGVSRTAPATPRQIPTVPDGGPAPGGWAARLARLDAVRSRAFATRDPTLLARVYATGSLRTADTRTLLATVPVGCRLTGLHTEFRITGVRHHAGRTAVTATAALQPSVLRCPGQPPRRAAGTTAVPVRVTLARTGAGPRIVAERSAA